MIEWKIEKYSQQLVIIYRVYIHYQQKQTNQQKNNNTQDPNGNSSNKGERREENKYLKI